MFANTTPTLEITEQAARDTSFRKKLIANPQATIEEFFSTQLPKELKINVVEETENTLYIVLPNINTTKPELDKLGLDDVAGFISAPSETHVSCCKCSHTAPDTRKECGN